MFAKLVLFWKEVISVFVPYSYITFVRFNAGVSFNNGTLWTPHFSWNIYVPDYANGLAALTLIGLSIFLFYQVYKVVHAFIGGFYEDAI